MSRRLVLSAALSLAACKETGVVPRQVVAGGDASRGRAHVLRYGCGSCHVIPGIPLAVGRVGPSLSGVADRTYLAGGQLVNNAPTLVAWIMEPQRIRPGSVMPDLGVSSSHARDIAAYLYTLHASRLGPPHPIPAARIPGHGG